MYVCVDTYTYVHNYIYICNSVYNIMVYLDKYILHIKLHTHIYTYVYIAIIVLVIYVQTLPINYLLLPYFSKTIVLLYLLIKQLLTIY